MAAELSMNAASGPLLAPEPGDNYALGCVSLECAHVLRRARGSGDFIDSLCNPPLRLPENRIFGVGKRGWVPVCEACLAVMPADDAAELRLNRLELR